MAIDRQGTSAWNRVPGFHLHGSHWEVNFSIALAFTSRIDRLLIWWHRSSIVLDAHQRFLNDRYTVQYSVLVAQQFDEGVCDALRRAGATNVTAHYRFLGNHSLPRLPQLPVPPLPTPSPIERMTLGFSWFGDSLARR